MIGTVLLADGLWQRLMENPFYQNALWGGIGVALACGMLSTFVVLKRMSFIGEGVAHAGFGGLGVALLLGLVLEGVRPALARDGVIAVFCVATAWAIGCLARRGRLSEDAAIGICLVAAMALGVLLLDVRAQALQWLVEAGRLTRGEIGYRPDWEPILFGNIFFIDRHEVWLVWGLAAVVAVALAATFKELVFFTFDEETAEVFGVRTRLLYYGLLTLLALAIVAAMRSLGVVLATGLLVLPGAAAKCWSRQIGRVTLISTLIAVVGVTAGLVLAVWLGKYSPGPIIVLTLVLAFAVSSVVGRRRGR